MEGTDVCFAPVLTLAEVPHHQHIKARGSVIDVEGIAQNAPAPRFSRTPTGIPSAPRRDGQDTESVLSACGFSTTEIRELRGQGVIAPEG